MRPTCHTPLITHWGRDNMTDTFSDVIFKWIFLNEDVWILIKISLKFVSYGPINNIPALVQIMAWRRPGDKPLSEPMMVSLLTHIWVTRPQWVKLSFLVTALALSWNILQNILGNFLKHTTKHSGKLHSTWSLYHHFANKAIKIICEYIACITNRTESNKHQTWWMQMAISGS